MTNSDELVQEIDTLLAHWIGCPETNSEIKLPSQTFPHIFSLLAQIRESKGKRD